MIEEASKLEKPQRERSGSLGDLSSNSTRRLLIDLISTLNASFPDYDFSSVSPASFEPQEINAVVSRVNSFLAELTIQNSTIMQDMWQSMNTVMRPI
jgi:hypothetical protein